MIAASVVGPVSKSSIETDQGVTDELREQELRFPLHVRAINC